MTTYMLDQPKLNLKGKAIEIREEIFFKYTISSCYDNQKAPEEIRN